MKFSTINERISYTPRLNVGGGVRALPPFLYFYPSLQSQCLNATTKEANQVVRPETRCGIHVGQVERKRVSGSGRGENHFPFSFELLFEYMFYAAMLPDLSF